MALTAADFTFPTGPFRAAQFPGDDLAGALTVWITDAEERVAAVNAATGSTLAADGPLAKAWVTYRGYEALCTSPVASGTQAVSSVSVEGKGSISYSTSGAASKGPDYCALASEWYDRAGALATVYDTVPVVTEPLRRDSVVVAAVPQWPVVGPLPCQRGRRFCP